jgi:hypothetical protein
MAGSPEPLVTSSLILDAKTKATKTTVHTRFQTSYGSYDKTYNRERTLEGNLRNLGRTSYEIIIESYFIGKHIASNDRLIVKSEKKAATIGPNGNLTFSLSTGNVESRDLKYVIAGTRDTSGARIEGWLVAVRDAKTQQLYCCKGSDSHLEVIGRTPAELNTLQKNTK